MAASAYYNHEIGTLSDDVDYEGSIDEDAFAATTTTTSRSTATTSAAAAAAMKVDHSKLRKSTSEPPPECRVLIDRLKKCNRMQLLEELSKISTWTFGKCELGHWKEVLVVFDSILDEAAETECGNAWALKCDTYDGSNRKLLLWVLHFTTLLIEHSFSRHTYKSMDKLLALLAASDMSVVLGVLNLLYMFSKRSNFITRMQCILRASLVSQLHYLAESWGGKENGFGLADCCSNDKSLPPSATTLHFEFHVDNTEPKDKDKDATASTSATATSAPQPTPAASSAGTPTAANAVPKEPIKSGDAPRTSKQSMTYIHVEHVDQLRKTPGEIMKGILALYNIPAEKEMLLFTHVRLAYHFSNYRNRLLCVQARLQALSVLVYANALQDSAHTLLYNGLLEELVELIELKLPYLVEIRSAALRTLTSIIHLDRNPHFPKKPGSRLNNIIDVTGASQYHGFLPVLVRNCISSLTSQTSDKTKTPVNPEEALDEPKESLEFASEFAIIGAQTGDAKGRFPLPLATALFSFLYHLASYESGGDALVSCGMMESLLQVINWHGVELEHITFVTRAVRVIDLITNVDMQAFYTHGGLQSFISRLDVEVNLCVSEHPYVLSSLQVDGEEPRPAVVNPAAGAAGPSGTADEDPTYYEFQFVPENMGKTCLAQRTALLKSMLNFLKKALQDSTFSEHIRHLMEGTLPTSLKHIISNAEYYGPSLFLLATDVVTVYVFQEPSLLSTIQDNGLTDVVLQALLVKDVPATREVLASLPNVFSALCLNARGLQSFSKCKPFERLFKVLLSPTYLSAMRKRRSSDPLGDAATNLGNAMDELMRHQPSLKVNATTAIVQLLNELCVLGTDPKYVCWRPHSKSEASPVISQRSNTNATDGNSSDEEDEDEEEASTSSQNAQTENQETQPTLSSEKQPIALTEYILNVTKFVDAILSNNSTDDHCREFVTQNGLVPLLRILGLPNLPVDCPITNSAQAVASVCKSILNLAHESRVLDEGLSQLNEVLQRLTPLYLGLDMPRGSKLLHELANAPHLETAFSTASATPLLHAMSAAHGYVLMFVHVCRTGQNDIRTLSLQHWGSVEGLNVLKGLAELYTSLVWESTLLLALCSDDVIQSECDFGKEDMEKLNISTTDSKDSKEGDNVASAMEQLTTNPTASTSVMDVDAETTTSNKPTTQQLKYIKPLLGASSRLGRALAELFGLLVKLCVGSPLRQRRGQNMVSTPALSTTHARSVATALNILLANGLNIQRLPPSPVPKFRLTFLICSVGFTSPMLFDEKKYPYHLMLHKFVALGGQVTFFNAFEWALSAGGTLDIATALENPNLPEGTGEFLDAWLTLLEKMVNPKAILDSPHVISTRAATAKNIVFDPLKYLMQIHSDAFNAVMLLWGKKPLPNYGVRMSDAILTILKHILRGERIIHEKLNKTDDNKSEMTPSATPATTGGTATSSGVQRRPEDEAMSESLNALLDMGFLRDPAMDALNRTINLEQATEYLLATPQVSMAPQSSEIDMSEDDQMVLAIAMSLGDNGSTTDGPKRKEIPKDPKPIPEKVIDEFTCRAPDVCLELIETVPESVFRVCDLLVTIMKRNGATFKQNFIENLLQKIKETTLQILNEKNNLSPEFWCQSDPSRRLAYYTHLYTLFYEVPSYFEFDPMLVYNFIDLLKLAGEVLTDHPDAPIPKWLTPVLLLLDSFGKVSVSTQRKCEMHLATNRTWKWYDIVSGKWTKYSEANNKIINDAYWIGEQTVRISCGRRRYTISFTSMQQINEESNNNRPISMTPANLAKIATLDDGTPIQPVKLTEKEASRCVELKTFTKEQAEGIVTRCTVLMKCDIDKDTLHAIMGVCLRLTQDFDIAKLFVANGGIQCLLKYNEKYTFSGFRILATLLIRHALEGPAILAYAMEKVIRGRTLATLPASYKELMFLVRSIGSAVTRNPKIFLETAKNTLRIDNSRRNLLDEDTDARLLLNTEPSRSQAPAMTEKESVDAVYSLLNALLRPVDDSLKLFIGMLNSDGKGSKKQAQEQQTQSAQAGTSSATTASCMFQRASDLLSNNGPAPNDILNMDSQEERSKLTRTLSESSIETQILPFHSRAILTKPNILKILADSVVSYPGVARLITDYVYDHNTCEELQEDCTCLAFLFDKILPIDEAFSDRECSNMCRTLIAGIASCNHAPEAQLALVTEVKAALIRALLMPESNEKHNRIQHITGIILSMIEQCPPVQQVRIYKSQTFNANVNNIARLMLRKGIFNDLARVPHCLDMSSPNFAATINSALKPMECLSKIVNQPVTGNITGSSARKRRRTYEVGGEAGGAGTGGGTGGNGGGAGGGNASGTSTDVTNAQGEDAAEDAENTEHDLSAVASSLGGNFFNVHVNVLDEIVEQLLVDRGQNGSSGTMDIDDESNMVVFDDHERDATEEMMSTDSGDSGDSGESADSEDDVDDGEDENAENTLDENNEDDDDDENDEEEEEDDVETEEEDDDRAQPLEFNENEEFANMDRDEDIVMLQYADHESEHDSLPRMVRWNENGFTIPTLQFDESNNSSEQTPPPIHPLLVSRQSQEAAVASMARNQRTSRTRRYQYFQVNTRNTNPPVILQRLLGPAGRNLHIGASNVFNSTVNVTRGDSARVVVMDNIGLFPSVEEQIDFVDQTGYIFGPSMLATINHIPVVLHWWKEESRFIDGDSIHDVVTSVSNDLIPALVKHKKQAAPMKMKIDCIATSTPKEEVNRPFWTDEGGEEQQPQQQQQQQPLAPTLPLDPPVDMPLPEARPDPPLSPPVPLPDLPLWITPPHEMIDLSEFDQNDIPAIARPVAVNLHEGGEDGELEQRAASAERNQEQRQEVDIVVSENPSFSPDSHSSTCEEDADSFTRNYLQEQEQTMTDDMTNNQNATTSNDDTITPASVAAADAAEPAPPSAFDTTSTSENPTALAEGQNPSGTTVVPTAAASRIETEDEIPDGVDPSFLEALPPEMRREVLEQHRMLRLQERITSGTVQQPQQPVASGSSEVSPEFLAALPPSLQEEVLTQQRLEQQRQAATRANPDEPVDAASFFETLQPSLRTMILSDMEDSQMSALPPDLAAEAQTLRRDWEARNRQMQVQERFLEANLTTIIRHTGRGRLASRFNTTHLLPQWTHRQDFTSNLPSTNVKIRGRQLLDHEALSCLLVLLFVDDPKMNTSRLHRVIRNLCHHVPTRDWVVRALLSIIDRSVHVKPDDVTGGKAKKTPKPGPLSSKLTTDSKNMGNGANWLNIRMEAALGCHANVFIVNRAPGKRTEKNSSNSSVTIHAQAAPIVCRNALDIFTSLSRTFPTFLLPLKPKEKNKTDKPPTRNKAESTDFWDMLLKLDAASTKKGKSLNKAHNNFNLGADSDSFVQSFEQSAFGALLGMLNSNVIKGSIQLTDKLLRLLSVISAGMPELAKGDSNSAAKTIAQNYDSVAAPEAALNLAVNVLTYKSCSEEGLEDVTTLLLNLSTCSLEMSRSILNLLLQGAKRIGEIVQRQIANMLKELQRTHTKSKKAKEEPSASTSKGILNNRFTNEHVVITASSKVKTSCDLQLPSMAPLTSKSSSQVFFLRVLRVIVQIREAITNKKGPDGVPVTLGPLSEQLDDPDGLWMTLSMCLLELEHTPDHHAVLVLQPAVEAFFLVHSPPQETTTTETAKTTAAAAAATAAAGGQAPTPGQPQAQGSGQPAENNPPGEAEALVSMTLGDLSETPGRNNVLPEHQKFLTFAEMHRTVLNQILRQTTSHLADGPFSVLVDHTRVLDFDIKRRYFRTELDRLDQNIRREETAVHVRREHVFEDSFRELYRRSPEEWKNRFYIVFEDEEGQDAGGLLREWYVIISRDIFNPMYALFTVSPGDRVTYMINSASHYNPNHLCYYKFVGRVIAKAIYDNKLLECYFTRSFYKHILGIPVKYTDMESEDYSFYRGLVYLMENNINNFDCDLSFSTEINEFGVTETRDLIPNGRNVPVTEENKMLYVRRSCQMKMTGAIRQQLTAFLEGFYDIIPKRLISIFNEQELELLISGLPNVDIEDLKANSEYHKYQANSLQIQWFWRALRSFDQADRAKFLQFVTGTSKVPLQGFGALEGMNGVQKFQIHRDDRSTDRLPSAHTCFNQLDLPVYETYDKLRSYLLKAIHECSEGFGFA